MVETNVIVAWPHKIKEYASQLVVDKYGRMSPWVGRGGLWVPNLPRVDSVPSMNIHPMGNQKRLRSVQPAWPVAAR